MGIWRVYMPSYLFKGAKMSVLGLILYCTQYLRSAMVRFPLHNILSYLSHVQKIQTFSAMCRHFNTFPNIFWPLPNTSRYSCHVQAISSNFKTFPAFSRHFHTFLVISSKFQPIKVYCRCNKLDSFDFLFLRGRYHNYSKSSILGEQTCQKSTRKNVNILIFKI